MKMYIVGVKVFSTDNPVHTLYYGNTGITEDFTQVNIVKTPEFKNAMARFKSMVEYSYEDAVKLVFFKQELSVGYVDCV